MRQNPYIYLCPMPCLCGERIIMPLQPDQDDLFTEPEGTREYWGNQAAGCIFVAKDTGRILLAQRSDQVDYEPGTWGTWGGKIDGDETPIQAVEREVEEETGFSGGYKVNLLYVYKDGNFSYHNYMVIVPYEFTPQLNWENETSAWVEYGHWPEPLHFGMEELVKHAGTKIKRVVDLLKKRKEKTKLSENQETPIQVLPQGLINISTQGYKWVTPYGYLAFGHDKTFNIFYLMMIQTKPEFQNKGYSKELLRKFFEFMKKHNGKLDPGAYTMKGMAHTEHVLKRFSKEFKIPLVKGNHPQDG
jgi:8-oxo-dGTP pyrophosphatase MutT (NUDIX family)